MKRSALAVLASAAAMINGAAWGMFGAPEVMPVARVLQNAQAYATEHPDDADAHFVLARVHYLCFATQGSELSVYEWEHRLDPPLDWSPWDNGRRLREEAGHRVREEMKSRGKRAGEDSDEETDRRNVRIGETMRTLQGSGWPILDREASLKHAETALQEFDKAISLAPKNALYFLGRGSLQRQFLQMKDLFSPPLGPDSARTLAVREQAMLDDFLAAFHLAAPADAALEQQPTSQNKLVSAEAGQFLLDFARENPGALKMKQIREIIAQVVNLDAVPAAITPIIFSIEPSDDLASLLAPNAPVAFDLDGDGRTERWPWLRPQTALLVWDPEGRGNITSGRQLFGSVTWWLLFPDGYRALDVLDDDRDGTLRDAELQGLSAWFDRNGDGRSSPGEVMPLQHLGVESVATRATGHDGTAPMNPSGLTLSDGRRIATYDWTTSPVP